MKKYLELGDEICAHLQHMTKTKHQSFCRKKHFAKYIHLVVFLLGFIFFFSNTDLEPGNRPFLSKTIVLFILKKEFDFQPFF